MIIIRLYAPGEELALRAVFQSSVHGLACRDYSPDQIEAWAPGDVTDDMRKQWIERIQSNSPYVAEVDGQLAGFADVQPSGYIDQFFVAAEFAGLGVGGALMRHLLDVARSRNIPRLFSHVSLTAQPFFKHFGFHVEQELRPVRRGVELRNALMSRQLDRL